MEFRQLEAFVNVVKYESFSKAADICFLTQSTVSIHVNNLEKELGVRLINRSNRDFGLTEHGKKFYYYATELINTREKAIRTMRRETDVVEGMLEIQSSNVPCYHYLPDVIMEFHKKYPKVRFYVEQTDSHKVNQNLLDMRGEVGFTGYQGDSGLAYETVFQDDVVVITPDNEKFAQYADGDELGVELFINEPFIVREEGSGTKQDMKKTLINGEPIFKNIDVAAVMSNMMGVKALVKCGMGVSVVTRVIVTESDTKEGLRWFKIKGMKNKRKFYMVYNPNSSLSSVTDTFIKFVRNRQKTMSS